MLLKFIEVEGPVVGAVALAYCFSVSVPVPIITDGVDGEVGQDSSVVTGSG